MRRGRVMGWTVGAALLAAGLAVGLAGNGSGGHERLAPALPREVLAAPSVTVASMRGRPAFVLFWASWCGPCQEEAPALQRFSQELGGRARLVGVDFEDEASDARAFINMYHWTFTSLRDGGGDVGRAYGVSTGLPTTFVLDSQGRLRETLRGPQTTQTLTQALARVIHG